MAARAGIFGAKARFYDAKRTLDQGVTKAYVAALLAEDNVKVFNQSSGYLTHEAQIAEARFKAGDISDADKKQIEINAEQYELQAKAAEAAAVQARIAVEVLMGVNQPKGHWTPTDSLEQLVNVITPPAPETRTNAARTDVLAAEADLRGGNANLKLQKAIRVPDPTFLAGIEHNPPGGGPPTDTMEIGVSFPLPIWNLNRGNIKAAEAGVEQFKLALGKVKAQVVADIANAETGYNEAYTRWLRYRDQTGPKSTKVRESIAYAYEKGGASLVNLLDAERTDNDIRLAIAQAMNDTASAVADLIAAREVLSETELNQPKMRKLHNLNCRNYEATAPAPRRASPGFALLKTFSVLAIFGLLGCHKEPEKAAGPPEPKVEGEKVVFPSDAPQLTSLTVQTAEPRTLAITHLTGRLYWNDDTTVRIFTPVSGRVTRILNDLGDSISVGTPLAEIDSPDFGQALADARTSAGNLAAAEKAFNRSKDLFAHHAAAQKDVEAAEAAYTAALAERDRAAARLANYGGNDKSTNALYTLHSPIAGVLVEKNINPGQELRADQMLANAPNLFAPLFVISDPTRLWLQVDVAESDLFHPATWATIAHLLHQCLSGPGV